MIQEGTSHLSQVKDISYLAIDETDRMVEKGHFEELQNLLEMINEDETKKKRRQTFVFSATLSLIHELPKHLKDKKGAKQMTSEEKLKNLMEMIGVKPRPKIVDLSRKVGMTAETLIESRHSFPRICSKLEIKTNIMGRSMLPDTVFLYFHVNYSFFEFGNCSQFKYIVVKIFQFFT